MVTIWYLPKRMVWHWIATSTIWLNNMFLIHFTSQQQSGIQEQTKVLLWELWDPALHSWDLGGVSQNCVLGNKHTDLGPGCEPCNVP